MGTLVFASGRPNAAERAQAALDSARALIEASGLARTSGATLAHPRVLVLRALAPVVEPVMQLFKPVRAAWRTLLWGLPGTAPRIWRM